MYWKPGDAWKFYCLLPTASVEDLKDFVARTGHLRVPEDYEIQEFHSVVRECLKSPYGALRKVGYLINDGMWSEVIYSSFDFSREWGWGGTGQSAQTICAFKEILQLFLDSNFEFDSHVGHGAFLASLFYDDVAFLNRLEAHGVDFHIREGERGFADLLANGLLEAAKYMASKGHQKLQMGVGDTCRWKYKFSGGTNVVVVSELSQVDLLISEGFFFSPDNFYSGADFDLYCYGIEKSGSLDRFLEPGQDKLLCQLWEKVLDEKRIDIGDWLLSKGVPPAENAVTVSQNDTHLIDWGLESGLKLNISVKCDRPTLMYAARHGLEPVGSECFQLLYRSVCRCTGPAPQYIGQDEHWYSGMQYICETLDAELIGAFLDAGFTENIDVSAAVDLEKTELLELYRSHGVSLNTSKIVVGSSYVSNGVAIVPEGIAEVGDWAFAGLSYRSVKLPDSLKTIGENAFYPSFPEKKRPKCLEVVIPKSVEWVSSKAFAGFDKITVYDTISPNSKPAGEGIDSLNGHPNSPVGWVGMSGDFVGSDRDRHDYEITVRSADTDEIKYRVFMALNGEKGRVAGTLLSAWGKNASFYFPALDELFEDFVNRRSKVKTCVNRLRWPVDLTKDSRRAYRDYLCKYAKAAVAVLAEERDLEGVKVVVACGGVKRSNIKALIDVAEKAKCRRIATYLSKLDLSQMGKGNGSSAKQPPSSSALGGAAALKKYGEAFSRDVETAGITVTVKFAPSCALMQLQKFIAQGIQLVPCKKVKKLGCDATDFGSDGHDRVSPEIPDAAPDVTAGMLLDFIRVMALFTDDEALARLVEDAPKKEDGHLLADSLAFSCYMEGMSRECELCQLEARCSDGDVVEIAVVRKSYRPSKGFGNSRPAQVVLASTRYSDIVDRMGLEE